MSAIRRGSLFGVLLLATIVPGFPQSIDATKTEMARDAAYTRSYFLLENKAFLDQTASDELQTLTSTLSQEDIKGLYRHFEVQQFLISPPSTRFAIFPQFEDNTANIAFSCALIVGVPMYFYASMIGAQYDHGPTNGIIGGIGATLEISGWIYFMFRPVFSPNAYDKETVNREMRELLGIRI